MKQTSIKGVERGGRVKKKRRLGDRSEFEISLHSTVSKSDLNCRKSNMYIIKFQLVNDSLKEVTYQQLLIRPTEIIVNSKPDL